MTRLPGRTLNRPKMPKRRWCGAIIVTFPPSLPYNSGLNVSPDGRWIAYVTRTDGNRHLVLRQIDQLDARVIPHTVGARRPFFSPDSKWVGFFSQLNASMCKISVYGENPKVVCRNTTLFLGAHWGEDDYIVFSNKIGAGLFRIAAAGGAPERLTTLDQSFGELTHAFPHYLPGAKVLLYTAATGVDVASSRVVALNLVTGEQKTVAEGATRPHFAPTGHITFTQRGSVSVALFDVDRMEIAGPIVPMTEASLIEAESDFAHYAFSKDGLLVYAPMGAGPGERSKRVLVWVDRLGAEERIPTPPRFFLHPRVSPDGKCVALSMDEWRGGGGYKRVRGTG